MVKKPVLFKRTLVIGIIILLVGMCINPSTGIILKKTTSATIGPRGYIQDLIDNASDGDTIYIPSGVYYEHILIDKSISLIGEDKNTTIIEGNYTGSVVRVYADWVNISGFTIEKCGWLPRPPGCAGIQISNCSCSTITDNIFSNNSQFGISVHRNGHIITRNIFYNNFGGIYLLSSGGNTITSNIFYNNSWSGIGFLYSAGNTITSNIFYNNLMGISLSSFANTIDANHFSDSGIILWGIDFFPTRDHIIVNNTFINAGLTMHGLNNYNHTFLNNTVNGKPLVYLEDESDIVINDAGQVILIGCDNITVQNQNFSHTSVGICVLNTKNCSFFNNTFYSNERGIYIEYSNNNKIYHNRFENNEVNAEDWGWSNTWDDGYPSGGNYWDDYNGTDNDGDGIGDTPYQIHLGGEDRYPLGNFRPDKPMINGKTQGKPGVDYDYTFVTTDPEGDDVWYHICWGDKEIIYIYGPFPSGEEITISYNWSEKGTYFITCYARDIHDAVSNVSTLEVTIPRDKAVYNPFLNWLQSHPNLFLLVQKLLQHPKILILYNNSIKT